MINRILLLSFLFLPLTAQESASPKKLNPPKELLALSDSFRAVAKSIKSSVVIVNSVFYEKTDKGLKLKEGKGTGLVFDDKGHIVTNYHVIKDAAEISVISDLGRSYKAQVVGSDSRSDLAVLFVESLDLPPATLGDSDKAQVGDWAIAVGQALQFEQTVTVGVISAKGRYGLRSDEDALEDFIQTDAAINHGNSGGPLCNIYGEVIGINAMAMFSRSHGLGFSIPVNLVKKVVLQLIQKGRVDRGFLGVVIRDLPPIIASELGYPGPGGVLVDDVESGSPASRAGLIPGDIISAAQNRPVKDRRELRNRVNQLAPGDKLNLLVFRDGETIEKSVLLEQRQVDLLSIADRVGLEIRNPTVEEKKSYETKGGVIVTHVVPGSPGHHAPLSPGWMITKVDKREIEGVDSFLEALEQSFQSKNGKALLYVRSGRSGFFLVLEQE